MWDLTSWRTGKNKMTINHNPSQEELIALWKVCTNFIQKQTVRCAENTIDDRVYVNAPELVEAIGNITGYEDYPSED